MLLYLVQAIKYFYLCIRVRIGELIKRDSQRLYVSYKVLKLIFHTQTYSSPHVTERKIHRGHTFHAYTHVFTCEFAETSVHVCRGNIKH